MPILYQKRIYRDDLKANPTALYLFGDNEIGVGLGGQAGEMRGEPNAHGIPTLYAPGRFWSDDNFEHNAAVLKRRFAFPIKFAKEGNTIVVPLDGLGTGLAELPTRAPKTYAALQEWMQNLVEAAAD